MPLDILPLIKVLQLEEKRGFSDTAVFGGLDKFLPRWTAAVAVTDPKLLTRFNSLLIKTSYASLTVPQRREWTGKVLSVLSELSGDRPNRFDTEPVGLPHPVHPRKLVLRTVNISLDASIISVKGISQTLAEKFGKLGVRTVRDLLYFFPNRHLDYSRLNHVAELTEGPEQTIVANVWEAHETRVGGRPRRSTEATVGDETGNIRAIWFNNPWLAKTLKANSQVVLSGRVSSFRGQLVFENPEWEFVEDKELVHTGRLVPLYHLTAGLHPRQVRKLMKEVVDYWAPQVTDYLPADLLQRDNLLALPEAIRQAHFPDDATMQVRARCRLAFDELFLLQLGVLRRKQEWQLSQPGNAFHVDEIILESFTQSLPFALTTAQQRVVREIAADLARPVAMSRLLQGEVGSGKTVVATIALLIAAANGYQGALMAPTEILAEQHFKTLAALLARTGIAKEMVPGVWQYFGLMSRPLAVALLTGAISEGRKHVIQQQITSGAADIVIGTHTLVQEDVTFRRLGLAVVDEQHRFGVEQRSILRQKGFNSHVLVMTATPIPRTLALTLYGDLDLSVIDQLPPGRQEIKTKWLRPEQREAGYNFIRKQVAEGHQAFIICPLIEESVAVQAKAATAEYRRLSSEVFPDLRLGLLHGRLSNADKEVAMARFSSGDYHILVATPVVEVGIDIPNATVMLVESADRFGLSQLHQFRGRVGRGTAQSYCMLLADDPSEVGRARLDIIEKTQNGFVLAEEDLKQRGPGEFFGTRQSGLPDLKMAKLSDVPILELARREAIALFKNDPSLKKPEHGPVAQELTRVWPRQGEWS